METKQEKYRRYKEQNVTVLSISRKAHEMHPDEIKDQIQYLLEECEAKYSEYLSEDDYKEFYNTAKEYWQAFDMPTKGYTEEIKKCMWKAFQISGINISSKKEFLNITKYRFQKCNVQGNLYNTMMT